MWQLFYETVVCFQVFGQNRMNSVMFVHEWRGLCLTATLPKEKEHKET